MELFNLVDLSNKLDSEGLYKDAQIIDEIIRECANGKRPNYQKWLKYLTPMVAAYLATYGQLHVEDPQEVEHHHQTPNIHQTHQTPIDTGKKIYGPKMPENYKPPYESKGNFDTFKLFVDDVEGGIDDRDTRFDPGGLTNAGITQGTYDRYRKIHKLKEQSVLKMTPKERVHILKSLYWDTVKADLLPKSTAMALADWKFNGGFAPGKIQKMLKIPVTGFMDENTIKAIWNYVNNDPKKDLELAKKINSARQKYLESLTTTVNNKKVPLINYNRGWYARLNNLESKF